jgi:hypothetical protein
MLQQSAPAGLALQAVPAVQPLRPGAPMSYLSPDGQALGYEPSSFQQQVGEEPAYFEQPFSQTGPYVPDGGYYVDQVDEALYDAQTMQQSYGMEDAAEDQDSGEPQSNQFMSLLNLWKPEWILWPRCSTPVQLSRSGQKQ